MGGGGDEGPAPAKKAVQVSYKKDKTKEQARGGSNRRTLGSQYLQGRKATPQGGGFGGQKQTLG